MSSAKDPGYDLKPDGQFVIREYNHTKPFSNFFPGVAGLMGIPMWVFYVNRGQCISSFGVESKDNAILEFKAANNAYRLTSSQGFRTFLKVKSGNKVTYYEPFQNSRLASSFKTKHSMSITSHDLTIEDINETLGLVVRVNYFTLPEEPFAALVRHVSIENISRKKYEIEIIDGLPAVVAFGIKDVLLKNMPRTVEAWIEVNNLHAKAPFFHLKVEVSDKPQVTHIPEGNFYFSFDPKKKKNNLLSPIVMPEAVFGLCSDFSVPESFLSKKDFKVPTAQFVKNQTPCAMCHAKFSLTAGTKRDVVSVTGYAPDESHLNTIVKKVSSGKFINAKTERNKAIVDTIKDYTFTQGASHAFNAYTQQTFLDNVLRGGLPAAIKTEQGEVTFNVFSRKHGDPERDYNFFVLSPTYFSQGNGNYRDVNQNRRNDIWFNPLVKDSTIIQLLSLIQADGYNPLVVKGTTFSVDDPKEILSIIKACVARDAKGKLKGMLQNNFQPGALLKEIDRNGIKLKVSEMQFLRKVLGVCQKHEAADFGDGYWSDHWTYNLDLIESYLSLFPENLRTLLLEKKVFSFYHSPHFIVPRYKRYIATENGVRQYASVEDGSKEIKTDTNNKLRTNKGKGPVYYTHLLGKLLCLVANKIASLDPSGIGVEMEADKPNWYDSLNGLPGLLGSSISETFEIKRMAMFLLKSFDKLALKENTRIRVYGELAAFIASLTVVLSSELDALSYWKKSNELKERYRTSVLFGLSENEKDVSLKNLQEFLELVIKKVDRGIKMAKNPQGLYSTYFTHEVTKFERLQERYRDQKVEYVRPLEFKKHALPLFLEGFVHALRVEKEQAQARMLYERVRESALFDKELKMYKVNADLSSETEEIGRTRIFPRGWLENESVWLHMEYKFLLELLRNQLFKEFYANAQNILVPFQDPKRYGRSILENSSFIVSSAHKDPNLHGQGFVARLSGSTAEFVHMWLLMNLGPQPFFINDQGELCLRFKPALADWLFTAEAAEVDVLDRARNWYKVKLPKDTYAFKFLNSVLVVYHNPHRKNTFGKDRARINEIHLTYLSRKRPVIIKSPVIPAPYAEAVRSHKVDRIDVFME